MTHWCQNMWGQCNKEWYNQLLINRGFVGSSHNSKVSVNILQQDCRGAWRKLRYAMPHELYSSNVIRVVKSRVVETMYSTMHYPDFR
jgi:hypothetical protein